MNSPTHSGSLVACSSAVDVSSRRHFLQRAALFSIVAPHVLGLHGATPPSGRLNLACVGIGGRGGDNLSEMARESIVALCDVDEQRGAKARERFPKAKFFRDYRRLFDQLGKEIDAVAVSTPDHTHAVIAMAAIQLGKDVYCEKPLAHSLHEVRRLTEAAREKGVITQLGNQGHSFDSIRQFCEMVWAGAIGTVTEVHAWCQNSYRPRGFRVRPPEVLPVPPTLDWDLWLGPAARRPYHSVYLPGTWRGWVDFGTGILGDWTCHVVDPVFWALNLGAPSSVEAEADEYDDPKVRAETFPPGCIIRYEFPAREKRPAVRLTWHDGSRKAPRPPELEPNRELPGIGALVIGDRGKILYGSHGAGGAQIIPKTKNDAFVRPAQSIARSPGHHAEWLAACKSRKPAGSNFQYGGALTEVALLGVLALRHPGQKLLWDSQARRVTNLDEANAWINPPYRSGWTL